MSATRTAIEQAIEAGEKRLAKIDEILNANHLSKVIELRRKANEIIQKHDDKQWSTIAKLIEPLAKEEKRQMAAFNRQNKNHNRLFQEQLRIDSDLRDLRINLARLNLRRDISQ
jgi:hypothetical protein